ncbi:MAG: hypothetical protein JWM31_338 [Solirubrobacterales bacterium]|nr:hypothetical protein [Solirubrobacterales bacterium]
MRRSELWLIAVVVALAGSLAVASAASARVRVRVLSSRPDLITGGDAVVAVDLGPGVDRRRLRVLLNGRSVTAVFDRSGTRGPVLGHVTGLHLGSNALVARLKRGPGARLRIVDHPVGGPLFSGPQIQPWRCLTVQNGLGGPVDTQCNAAHPVVQWFYKDTLTSQLQSYDPAHPPAAGRIARARTDEGRSVPYIVRKERGTLDRSMYAVAVLADPQGRPQWNHKLFVPFGGGCSARHSQTPPESSTPPGAIEVSQTAPDDAVLLDRQLSRGDAVATTGLSILAQNCNPVVSAEALEMLKEHVVKAYGEIRYTIGEGCSGGSVQQHMIADAYPGLLDGLIVECSLSDLWGPPTEVSDCKLLERYFTATSPALWLNPAARAAVEGQEPGSTCVAWQVSFGSVLDPADRASPITACDVPASEQYAPGRNPKGVRCSVQDYDVNIWGRRTQDGFARRPIDNVGIEYGRAALASGAISPEQFVDLNAKIGGLDLDFQRMPERESVDPETVRIAYTADQIVRGRNLARVPIIDLRGTGNAEVHTDYWSYVTRARLKAANGSAANQIIWTTATDDFVTVGRHLPTSPGGAAFDLMDRWLQQVHADTSARTLPQKVMVDKPADAVDACFAGREITDTATCERLFPHFASPRLAAGEPPTDDVVKCALRPIQRDQYPVTFTDDQRARLRSAFPDGVCDWAASLTGRPDPLTWPTFTNGPGGTPLGPVPASHALPRP